MCDMTKSLGAIPLIKTYLETLKKLILTPTEIGESAIFIWPEGNAKPFHLPVVIDKRPHTIYIDLSTDLTGTYPSFLEIFYKQVNLRQKALLVFNQLDSYPETEFTQIINFLAKIPQAAPYHFIFSIHLSNPARIKTFLEIAKSTKICHQIIQIPRPSEIEAKEIIAKTANLDLTVEQINKIYALTGSDISLIRPVLRIILAQPNYLKNIPAISGHPNFKFRINQKCPTLDKTENEFNLSRTEYRIYSRLITESNKFLSRDEVAEIIWGEKSFEKYSDWAINKTVSRLRQKILAATKLDTIKSVKGKGYQYFPNDIPLLNI